MSRGHPEDRGRARRRPRLRRDDHVEELTQASLDRIAEVDGAVHAFLHVDAEGALAAARGVRRSPGLRLARLAARRRADRGQGRARHQGPAHDLRVADPRGLGAAVRRHGGGPREGGRPADPRQDQHGRVRDGLLDRALGVRHDAQPVGPRPDPRRVRRRLGRSGGVVRGADRARHRHRWVDPPARRGHRHGRCEADLRRRLPLRPGRARQLARPGRPGDPDRPRLGAAPRGHRRPRPEGLHVDRPAAAVARRRGPAGRRRRPERPARRRRQGARRRGLPGRAC